jgi:hypothetical protein
MKPSSNETNSVLRPEDFPIRSPESRAAARAILNQQRDEEARIFIVNGNEASPDPRRQDLVIRICNASDVAENGMEPPSETSTLYCCKDGTVTEASLPSTDAVPQKQMEEPEPSVEPAEEHAPHVEPRRRPLVRPRPRRFRYPPSAFGG